MLLERKGRGVFFETLYKSGKACYNTVWICGTPERVSTQNKGERRKECAVYTATARRARSSIPARRTTTAPSAAAASAWAAAGA